MIVLSAAEIAASIDLHIAASAIEGAYRSASAGLIELPPVGYITFPDYDADCHIKYGHRRGDGSFVIKVATGFPANLPGDGPSNNGVVLVLSAETGTVRAVLHDEMLLTDVRTGLGGAIASRALARHDSTQVLIVGTGTQADRQIESHQLLIDRPLSFSVWGRSRDKAEAVAARHTGCDVADDLALAAQAADIIVTTTAARDPLITKAMVGAGTHVTAVGADAPGKRELAVDLLEAADVLVADSRSQCFDHGELAFLDGETPDVAELGEILADTRPGRTADDQITIADLTGIAAQDIAIAGAVLEAVRPDTSVDP